MKLLQVVGANDRGGIWTVNLPADSRVVSFGDRLLVASPMNLLWIDANGDQHQATSYPKAHEDNGN
jgi:hypothetical protein